MVTKDGKPDGRARRAPKGTRSFSNETVGMGDGMEIQGVEVLGRKAGWKTL